MLTIKDDAAMMHRQVEKFREDKIECQEMLLNVKTINDELEAILFKSGLESRRQQHQLVVLSGHMSTELRSERYELSSSLKDIQAYLVSSQQIDHYPSTNYRKDFVQASSEELISDNASAVEGSISILENKLREVYQEDVASISCLEAMKKSSKEAEELLRLSQDSAEKMNNQMKEEISSIKRKTNALKIEKADFASHLRGKEKLLKEELSRIKGLEKASKAAHKNATNSKKRMMSIQTKARQLEEETATLFSQLKNTERNLREAHSTLSRKERIEEIRPRKVSVLRTIQKKFRTGVIIINLATISFFHWLLAGEEGKAIQAKIGFLTIMQILKTKISNIAPCDKGKIQSEEAAWLVI
jgi:chromosome segregation ATPase